MNISTRSSKIQQTTKKSFYLASSKKVWEGKEGRVVALVAYGINSEKGRFGGGVSSYFGKNHLLAARVAKYNII